MFFVFADDSVSLVGDLLVQFSAFLIILLMLSLFSRALALSRTVAVPSASFPFIIRPVDGTDLKTISLIVTFLPVNPQISVIPFSPRLGYVQLLQPVIGEDAVLP